jgi:hypothetical protein
MGITDFLFKAAPKVDMSAETIARLIRKMHPSAPPNAYGINAQGRYVSQQGIPLSIRGPQGRMTPAMAPPDLVQEVQTLGGKLSNIRNESLLGSPKTQLGTGVVGLGLTSTLPSEVSSLATTRDFIPPKAPPSPPSAPPASGQDVSTWSEESAYKPDVGTLGQKLPTSEKYSWNIKPDDNSLSGDWPDRNTKRDLAEWDGAKSVAKTVRPVSAPLRLESPKEVYWGDPDRASDFFRASKQMQEYEKNDTPFIGRSGLPSDPDNMKRGGTAKGGMNRDAVVHKALEIIHHMLMRGR